MKLLTVLFEMLDYRLIIEFMTSFIKLILGFLDVKAHFSIFALIIFDVIKISFFFALSEMNSFLKKL